jgi:hypothetical protein
MKFFFKSSFSFLSSSFSEFSNLIISVCSRIKDLTLSESSSLVRSYDIFFVLFRFIKNIIKKRIKINSTFFIFLLFKLKGYKSFY